MPKTIKVEFKLEVDENIRQSDVESWVKSKLFGTSGFLSPINPLRQEAMIPLFGAVKIHWPEDKE